MTVKLNAGKLKIICERCRRTIYGDPLTRIGRFGQRIHFCSDVCKKVHAWQKRT